MPASAGDSRPHDEVAMEKRVLFRVALAALRADRAADRGHARLLLLAGGAGAVPVAAACRTRSAPARSSSGSRISRELFHDEHYLASFKITAIFSVLVAVLGLSISLLLAVLADRVVRGATVYKTLLIWPYAVAPAIAGVLWLFLFDPTLGIVALLAEAAAASTGTPAQRRPGDDAGRDRRGVEADQLQLPVLPRRPAVDPEVADRGGGDRRRRPGASASGPSSSRCCRRPRSSCSSSTSSTRSSTPSAIIDAATSGGPGQGDARSSSTRSTTTASRGSTSAARRRSRWC